MYHKQKNAKVFFCPTCNMPTKANFIFEVSIRIPEAFTLDSVVRSPRTFKPKDLRSACENNQLVVKQGAPPQAVSDLAQYVMTDFFAMAHATGLYNRQRQMWEALSQVNTIAVNQLNQGVFRKSGLPVFDLAFQDYKGKPLIMALLVTQLGGKLNPVKVLRQFIGRAQGKLGLTGALAFFPAPLPESVLQLVEKETFTDDPIARYESILPALRLPFDLLEAAAAPPACEVDPDGAGNNHKFAYNYTYSYVLKHPNLKKSQCNSPPCKAMRMVMPANKQADETQAAGACLPDEGTKAGHQPN